jgi:hypothetical protein
MPIAHWDMNRCEGGKIMTKLKEKVRCGMWFCVFFLNIHRRSNTSGTYEDQAGIHFVRLHSSTNYQDSHLTEKKSFTSHIPAQMFDDRSHKSYNTRAAPQKKFDNAQHDFVMFLFHVHLFICLSLSNSTYEYIALTTHGYPRFLALRSILHTA